jgi:hypothetical protein
VCLGDEQPQLRACRVLGSIVQLAQHLSDTGAAGDHRWRRLKWCLH